MPGAEQAEPRRAAHCALAWADRARRVRHSYHLPHHAPSAAASACASAERLRPTIYLFEHTSPFFPSFQAHGGTKVAKCSVAGWGWGAATNCTTLACCCVAPKPRKVVPCQTPPLLFPSRAGGSKLDGKSGRRACSRRERAKPGREGPHRVRNGLCAVVQLAAYTGCSFGAHPKGGCTGKKNKEVPKTHLLVRRGCSKRMRCELFYAEKPKSCQFSSILAFFLTGDIGVVVFKPAYAQMSHCRLTLKKIFDRETMFLA